MKEKGSIPLVLLLILAILGSFGAGYFLATSQQKVPGANNEVEQLNKQVADKEAEIQMLLEDKAAPGKKSTSTYDFSSGGIYSPLLSGKDIGSQEYSYRRQTITQKTLKIAGEDSDSPSTEVNIYEHTNATSDSPGRDLVMIEGDSPIVDIVWDPDDSFVNARDIRFYWNYISGVEGTISGVQAVMRANKTASNHPIIVRVWRDYQLGASSTKDKSVVNAKTDLKKFIDTLSLQKY